VILQVYGRVQGVGFRYFAVREASKYDIKGFVRNKPDGSVYVEAEGTPGNVDLFRQRIESGPAWGRVDRVEVQSRPVAGYPDFSVQY
jgi:acylphosphatase